MHIVQYSMMKVCHILARVDPKGGSHRCITPTLRRPTIFFYKNEQTDMENIQYAFQMLGNYKSINCRIQIFLRGEPRLTPYDACAPLFSKSWIRVWLLHISDITCSNFCSVEWGDLPSNGHLSTVNLSLQDCKSPTYKSQNNLWFTLKHYALKGRSIHPPKVG